MKFVLEMSSTIPEEGKVLSIQESKHHVRNFCKILRECNNIVFVCMCINCLSTTLFIHIPTGMSLVINIISIQEGRWLLIPKANLNDVIRVLYLSSELKICQ